MSDSETPWTVAHQTALFVEFSRQEYWSGLPLPSPGDLPEPGIKSRSPAFQADCLPKWTLTHNPASLKWELWTFWKMLKHFSLSPFFTLSLLFTILQGQRRDQLTCLGKSKVSCGRSAAQVNTRVSSLPARWGDRWAAVCPGTPIPTPMKAWLWEFRSPRWLWRPAFRSGSGCTS